jgi:cytochrome c-type biogenesis protein CcmE
MDKMRKTLFASATIVVVLLVGLWGVDLQGTLAVGDLTDEHIGKTVCVDGEVKTGTLCLLNNGSTVIFTMTDGYNEINVSYSKPQPVNLQDGMPVTVTGTMLSDRTIDAHRILSECPSKYETENATLNTTLKSIQ